MFNADAEYVPDPAMHIPGANPSEDIFVQKSKLWQMAASSIDVENFADESEMFEAIPLPSKKGTRNIMCYRLPGNTASCYSFLWRKDKKTTKLYACCGCKKLKIETTIEVSLDGKFLRNPLKLEHVCSPLQWIQQSAQRRLYKAVQNIKKKKSAVEPLQALNAIATPALWNTGAEPDAIFREDIGGAFGSYEQHQKAIKRALTSLEKYSEMLNIPQQSSLLISSLQKPPPATRTIPPVATAVMSQAVQQNADDFEYKFHDDADYWDQLRKIVAEFEWVANDIPSMSLLHEMPNCHPIFLIRKSDKKLIGSLFSIEMEKFTFSGMYYMHPDYRAKGVGPTITNLYIKQYGALLAKQPFIYRAIPHMTSKYASEYAGVASFYKVFTIDFESKTQLLNFFPISGPGTGHIVPIKDLSPRQFREFCEYDKFVTQSDRSKFLQDYYSIDLVKGFVVVNPLGQICGCAAVSPTGKSYKEALYKIGPVYASNKEDATQLIHRVVSTVKEPHAKFVILSRQKSAGDWILNRLDQEKIPYHEAGALGCVGRWGQVYHDESKPENIFIGQASPCFFDI